MLTHQYKLCEPLAQSVEQQPFKLWVVGSSPTRLTILRLSGHTARQATNGFASQEITGKGSSNLRSLSSSGLGHRPFTAKTGVQIPLGTP